MKKMFKICVLFIALSSIQAIETTAQNEPAGFIYTVNGKINIEELGFALPHEHIMSTFGAAPNYNPSYNNVSLFNQVVPYLGKLKSLGVITIFECTAAYFGRNVETLKALADSTGMQVITNTGFYGAYNDYYVPKSALDLNDEEIAKLWIDEYENGIDQTDIKPGFIKLGFDDGTPSALDKKLFRAGVLTHISTGLTIQVHTGNNPAAASEQLKILAEYKVSPGAWVWVHANKVTNVQLLIDAAKKGAWISLDGVNETNKTEYLTKINKFKEQNLLGKIFLSHDGNSFPNGGAIRKYEALVTTLIPELKKAGYMQEEIDQITIKNPQEAFKIGVRMADTSTSDATLIKNSKAPLFSAHFQNNELIIYPKNSIAPLSYVIYHLSGQQIKSGRLNENGSWVDTSRFPKGVYLIKVSAANGITATSKINKL